VYQKVYGLWLTALGPTHVIRERPVRSRSRVRFRPRPDPASASINFRKPDNPVPTKRGPYERRESCSGFKSLGAGGSSPDLRRPM